MENELPYLQSNKRVKAFFEKIKAAAVPKKFTYELLKRLGFTSSTDRTFISLLKKLGFLDQNGVPTERYKEYRHKGPTVLAEGMREIYSDLFAIDERIHKKDREKIKGVVSRVTGENERSANLMTLTFQSLCEIADFESSIAEEVFKEEAEEEEPKIGEISKPLIELPFRYNIEIHLPATTDISVYNAIFRSLREHLLS